MLFRSQPKNEKLVDRAIRIVAEATGVDRAEAERLFEAAGRNVKQAIQNYHG